MNDRESTRHKASGPRPLTPADFGWVLDLNQQHAVETSSLTEDRLSALVGIASYASAIDPEAGFLLAFDQDSAYAGTNFAWFVQRYPRFIYVDRIVVSPNHRGKGQATLLYRHLFDHAIRAGHSIIGCEVNADPPNPASEAFHEALDFHQVGAADVGDKHVRYLIRDVD